MNTVTIYTDDGKSFKGKLLETWPYLNKRWIKIKTKDKEIIINLLAVTSIHYPDSHPNNEKHR